MTILEAIDELIAYYEEWAPDVRPFAYSTQRTGVCPLCEACGVNDTGKDCTKCPWVRFTGFTCLDRRFMSATAAERIKRLQGWRERLIAEDQL
jgi:hypothetical protein